MFSTQAGEGCAKTEEVQMSSGLFRVEDPAECEDCNALSHVCDPDTGDEVAVVCFPDHFDEHVESWRIREEVRKALEMECDCPHTKLITRGCSACRAWDRLTGGD